MSEFPKKGFKIFTETGNIHEHAYIAWGNQTTQFYGYIRGYKNSADLLVNNAITSRQHRFLDTYIFPACFLYRQFIELALKNLYLRYSEDIESKKKKTIKTVSHDIIKIWEKVKPIIKQYIQDDSDQREVIEAVEDYIIQFAQEDQSSFAYRYPITKKLELVHKEQRRINVRNLMERMNELDCYFESIYDYIGIMKEFENEMISYYGPGTYY